MTHLDNDRRLELVKRMQTPAAPTDTPPANERIARLMEVRAQTLPLFSTSGSIPIQEIKSFSAGQKELLNLTYQDLQQLLQPFYIGMHEFLDHLKKRPEEVAYSYPSLGGGKHIGTVLPADDPNLRWFVDLSYGQKWIRNPKTAQEPRTVFRRIRSLLGFDPKIQIG